MRNYFLILIALFSFNAKSQTADTSGIPAASLLKNLKPGDSITYYQCHVELAIQQLSTSSGQTLTANQQKYTITEKYVMKKTADGYSIDYYTAALNVFPNKKFSGLKIREKPYWGFKKEKTFQLKAQDLKVFIALEKKGREAIEYDFAITKYTTNQLIIKSRKEFKQLVIDTDHVISKLITL
jgi:hypothetical protein